MEQPNNRLECTRTRARTARIILKREQRRLRGEMKGDERKTEARAARVKIRAPPDISLPVPLPCPPIPPPPPSFHSVSLIFLIFFLPASLFYFLSPFIGEGSLFLCILELRPIANDLSPYFNFSPFDFLLPRTRFMTRNRERPNLNEVSTWMKWRIHSYC